MIDGNIPCQRARQKVQSQIESAAGLQQVLYFLVALGTAEVLVEDHEHLFGHTQPGGAGKLAAYEFRYQSLGSVAAAAEFQNVLEIVVGIHKRGKRPSLAQR